MKNILSILITSFISGILFSSCSSNMSIVKRHYTKGYYVNWGKKKPDVLVTKKESNSSLFKTTTHVHFLPINEAIVTRQFKSNIQPKQHIIIADKTVQNRPVSKSGGKQTINQNFSISENQDFENTPTFSQATQNGDGGGGRSALSLLWIVIIIILILWLIGILAGGLGLGGLINLLLLIALILLILWLLRIA